MAGVALPAQPDYSNVSDPLDGQRHILRNDDLVLSFGAQNLIYDSGPDSYQDFGSTYTLISTNSKVDAPSPGPAVPSVKNGTAGCIAASGCAEYWFPYYQVPTGQNGLLAPPSYLAMGQAAGRFFNTDRDTLVQFPFQYGASNQSPPLLIWFTGDNGGHLSEIGHQDVSWVDGGGVFFAKVGDFNGDGYDDILMVSSTGFGSSYQPQMRIATAVDPNDPTKGFNFGPQFSFNAYGIRDVAVGDFNGDGISDFATTYIDPSRNLYAVTFSVAPATLTISTGGQVQLGTAADTGYHPITMTAGRFSSAPHDQLIVGSYINVSIDPTQDYISNGGVFTTQLIDFSGGATLPDSIIPKLIYTYSIPPGIQYDYVVFKLKAARLNPASNTDQLIWLSSAANIGSTLQVLTIDPSFNTNNPNFFTVTSSLSGNGQIPADIGNFWGQDIAIGNFDHLQASSTTPNTTERNPVLQIALGGINANYNGGFEFYTGRIYIYNVDPLNNFQLSQNPYTGLPTGVFQEPNAQYPVNNVQSMILTVGDFRGRSYRLGAPTKITLQKAQPSVILAAPPMHADFVTSATGSTGLLNLSVIPEGFYSRYELDTTQSTTSTNTNSLSTSFGIKLTAGAAIAIGDEDAGDGATVKDTATTTADLKTSAETKNGSFSTTEFSINQQTGLTDQLWIKDSLFYVYSYPVIGRTACPATSPACAITDQKPLTFQVSVPAPSEIKTPPASNLEWYQPPWEYGNIFSYPASYAQLQAYLPAMQKLSEDVAFYTDASNIQVKNAWNTGTNSSQTVSFDQNYSVENDLSSSVPEGLAGLGTGNVNGSFDVTASVGLGKALESSTSLSATTGITAQKPGSFAEPIMYAYAVKPVIFGRQPPAGASGTGPSADINTFGLLQTAYIADPTDTSAGLWWAQAYGGAPDIALNHPNRLIVSTPGLSSPTIPPNCRPTGTGASQMDCVELAPSAPDNPWMSEVHYMRGFFISSANFASQGVTPGLGPQLANATAGDKLIFTARVHNYSLAAMPTGSSLYVRFYGIQWNAVTNTPYPSSTFQVGNDVKVGPVPPFSATPGDPANWVLANSDTFDTTAYSGRYLTFFVVVWGQNSDGSLMQESTGHGLSALPGTLNSFADAVALEEVFSGGPSYSNNIGFYNAPLAVLPAPSGVPAAEPPGVDPSTIKLTLGKVKVSKKSTKASKPITVSTLIKAGKRPVNEFMVDFYDGDPSAGGRLFDVERVPFIKAKGSYRVKVNFRSNICGRRNIHIKAADGRPYAVTRRSQRVKIQCTSPKA